MHHDATARCKITSTRVATRFPVLPLLLLLFMLQASSALPHPWWGHNEANYDASLDPVVWSRPFVEDTVRRPRISRNHHHHAPLLEEPAQRRRQSLQDGHHRPRRPQRTRNLQAGNHNLKNNNNNYRKYLRRRRKLLLQTRC